MKYQIDGKNKIYHILYESEEDAIAIARMLTDNKAEGDF